MHCERAILRSLRRMGREGGVAKRRDCSGVKLDLEEDAEAIQSASQDLVNLPRAPRVLNCILRRLIDVDLRLRNLQEGNPISQLFCYIFPCSCFQVLQSAFAPRNLRHHRALPACNNTATQQLQDGVKSAA